MSPIVLATIFVSLLVGPSTLDVTRVLGNRYCNPV